MNDYQTPFEILGIENTADKKQIRVAYARLLKTVRPDEDPAAFQRLREARDNALWDMQFQEFETHDEDLDDPPPEQEPTQATEPLASSPSDEPRTDRLEPAAMAKDQEQAAAEFFIDHDAPDEDELRERIEQLFGPWNTPWDVERWQPILSDLGKLDMWTRKDFEFEIVAKLGDQSLGEGALSSTGASLDTRKKVMTLLNEEFGWLDNDAMIYDTLPDNKADRFIRILHTSLSKSTDQLSLNHSTPDGSNAQYRTVPLIETEDFNSFFGDPDSSEQANFKFYRQSAASDDWSSSWHLWGFLFSYGWTARRGLWRHTVALLAASYVGWFMLLGGPNGGAFTVIGLIIIVLTHSSPGWHGRRWLVQSAADAVRQADEKGLLNGLERAVFMANKGRRGNWYLVIMVFVIGWGARELPKQIIGNLGTNAPSITQEVAKNICAKGDVQCIAKICRSKDNYFRCAVNRCPPKDAKCIMALLDERIEKFKNKLDLAFKPDSKTKLEKRME